MRIAVLSGMASRRLLLATAAWAAFIVGGCAQEQQPGNGPTASSSPPGAMEASSSQGQSRTGSPAESHAVMAFPTGNRNTSDLLVEQIGPREVRVGQQYTYQIRVTNLTDQTLTGVVLHERMPQDFKLASNDIRREGDNGQARFEVGDLGPKQSKTIQVSGTPANPGTLDTCLSAQYNPPTLCSHIAVVAPAIKAVAEGPSQMDVCQDIDYRYTVTNTGSGTAHNVVLQANLPDGLTTADGQRTLTANVGDLAQGQSKTVNARLRATQPGRFTTEATVRSDAGDVRTQQIATDVRAPRLAVTISGPKEATMGQQIAYQVTVTNKGDAAAQATRVRLGATPGHVQFVNATGAEGAQLASGSEGGGQDLGNLAPGESRTMTVNFNVVQPGQISVDATAAAKCATDVTTYANTNIATITASTLTVTHDPDPVPVGSNVTYHLILENKGNAPDHNVRVTATLPESEQYVSANGGTEASANGRQVTFGPVDTLQPKQRVTWNVTAKALKPDLAQFQANMVSQATPQAAAKVEPTKLYAGQGGTETRTREAPQQERTNEAPATPPGQLNK